MKKADIYRELLDDPWRWNFSWRGMKLKTLEKMFDASASDILFIMRKIAREHEPPNVDKLPNSRCESCGMRIYWGQLEGQRHPYDPKILVGGTVEGGHRVRIRESHFASCPDPDAHRKNKQKKGQN